MDSARSSYVAASLPPEARSGRPSWWLVEGLVIAVAVAVVATLALTGVIKGGAGARARLPGSPNDFAFLDVTPSGGPLRFNPCQPVEYVVNLTHAPPGALAVVSAAVNQTSAATGIRFVYAGLSAESGSFDLDRPAFLPDLYPGRWAPVLISWDSLRYLPNEKHVGANAHDPPAEWVGTQPARVSGALSVNLDDPGPPSYLKVLLMHELGHVLGLAHASDPGEVMYPYTIRARDWGQGDLAGLAKVGRPAGCLPEPPLP